MATELTEFSLRVAGAVRAELARRNLSREHLIPVLGIGKNAVYARISGKQSFEVEEVAKIAAHLGIEVAALVSPAPSRVTASSASHRAPSACYICGGGEHPPTELHSFWSNADAARHFAAIPEGVLPSMTAVETLDPREALAS